MLKEMMEALRRNRDITTTTPSVPVRTHDDLSPQYLIDNRTIDTDNDTDNDTRIYEVQTRNNQQDLFSKLTFTCNFLMFFSWLLQKVFEYDENIIIWIVEKMFIT